jgi:hypothetical protein
MAIGLPAAMPATASAPAPRLGEVIAVDISRFVGLDGVSAEIDDLVAARAGRISPVAPATLVLLAAKARILFLRRARGGRSP